MWRASLEAADLLPPNLNSITTRTAPKGVKDVTLLQDVSVQLKAEALSHSNIKLERFVQFKYRAFL